MTTGIFLVVLMIALLFIGFPVFIALTMPAALPFSCFGQGGTDNVVAEDGCRGQFLYLIISSLYLCFWRILLHRGSWAIRLSILTKEMVGHFKGGIAITVVLASLVFGSISDREQPPCWPWAACFWPR